MNSDNVNIVKQTMFACFLAAINSSDNVSKELELGLLNFGWKIVRPNNYPNEKLFS